MHKTKVNKISLGFICYDKIKYKNMDGENYSVDQYTELKSSICHYEVFFLSFITTHRRAYKKIKKTSARSSSLFEIRNRVEDKSQSSIVLTLSSSYGKKCYSVTLILEIRFR